MLVSIRSRAGAESSASRFWRARRFDRLVDLPGSELVRPLPPRFFADRLQYFRLGGCHPNVVAHVDRHRLRHAPESSPAKATDSAAPPSLLSIGIHAEKESPLRFFPLAGFRSPFSSWSFPIRFNHPRVSTPRSPISACYTRIRGNNAILNRLEAQANHPGDASCQKDPPDASPDFGPPPQPTEKEDLTSP